MSRIIHGFRTTYCKADQAIVERGQYPDGSTSLVVKNAVGEPLVTATVSLEYYGEKPDEGNVFIKGWGDAEGSFQALHKAGIVGNSVRIIETGPYRMDTYECPLLVEV